MRAAPPDSAEQEAPPQPPQGQDQGEGPAAQSVKMIQQGFQALGKLIEQSGGKLPPEDLKLFQNAVQATDALVQSLMGPSGGEQGVPPKPPGGPQGPMPQNANAGARPMPQ